LGQKKRRNWKPNWKGHGVKAMTDKLSCLMTSKVKKSLVKMFFVIIFGETANQRAI
jgi:hypothetical protein